MVAGGMNDWARDYATLHLCMIKPGKKYFKKYESLSKEHNSNGTFKVVLVILILLINFAFSLYVIGRVNGFY